jgi:hypothetical protein
VCYAVLCCVVCECAHTSAALILLAGLNCSIRSNRSNA